jgi:hypothetical protein
MKSSGCVQQPVSIAGLKPRASTRRPRARATHIACRAMAAGTGTKKSKNNPAPGAASAPIQLLVNAATEGLRLAGVGGNRPAVSVPPGPTAPLPRRDVAGVMRLIREDFKKRAYFVTGVLSDAVYDTDCLFADPTISFKGRELWKRNLALLVPFLIDPAIDLVSLEQVGGPAGSFLGFPWSPFIDFNFALKGGRSSAGKRADLEIEQVALDARWRLETGLSLPWRPLVILNGSTRYLLHPVDANRVVSHVESWDISGGEALLLLVKPGPKREGRMAERR